MDFGKIFPRFEVLVLKSSSLLADFASHGFSFPQKIHEKQGLPAHILNGHIWFSIGSYQVLCPYHSFMANYQGHLKQKIPTETTLLQLLYLEFSYALH